MKEPSDEELMEFSMNNWIQIRRCMKKEAEKMGKDLDSLTDKEKDMIREMCRKKLWEEWTKENG